MPCPTLIVTLGAMFLIMGSALPSWGEYRPSPDMMPHNQRRGQNARCGRPQRRKLALIDPSVSDAQFGNPGNTDSTIKRAENNFFGDICDAHFRRRLAGSGAISAPLPAKQSDRLIKTLSTAQNRQTGRQHHATNLGNHSSSMQAEAAYRTSYARLRGTVCPKMHPDRHQRDIAHRC